MHLNSRLLFKKYAKSLFTTGMRVLEIGPDRNPSTFQKIVGVGRTEWETVDICPREALTYVARDEYHFPVADESYDIVLSGNVIEHVRKVWLWVGELARICKKGGHIVTINPVSWPYHEAPVDCWRIYPDGMKALYEEAGVQMEFAKHESLSSSGFMLPVTFVKEALKPILRKGSPMFGPVIDAIAIGVKI
jgi:SAM-dependent methyltransferase